MTPNLLMFGREVRMPIEVMLGVSKNPDQEEITSYGDYVDNLREQMQQCKILLENTWGRMPSEPRSIMMQTVH